MKKILLLLITAFLFSCLDGKKNKLTKLDGKYSVVDFRMNQELSKDSLKQAELIKLLSNSEYKFDFLSLDQTVKIEPKFGMKYFGDSIFEYSIDNKLLILKNPSISVNLPYTYENEILRLSINKKGVELFTIIPNKK